MVEGLLAQQLGKLAFPLVQKAIEKFIEPKVSKLSETMGDKAAIAKNIFADQFQTSLIISYKKLSILNTLIFSNQQKLLKDLYIPLTIKSNDEKIRVTIKDYSSDFLPKFKKVLVTDTAGMGKSTIMKKLFLSIIEKGKGIPILIELRRLGKEKNILDEILEQLDALKKPANKALVLSLIEKGDFIFLLDGFDEIPLLERSIVTHKLQDFISKANDNFFIMTSRPEGALASFGDFLQFSIEPLLPEQAYELLRKYNDYGELSKTLIDKIKETEFENIEEFLINPLLVSLLYTAFEHKQTIPFKKHIFYRQVYDAFFETHDLSKGDSYIRDKSSGLDLDDFHKVLRFIGFACLKKGKIEFAKDELLVLINDAKTFLVGLNFKASDFLKDIITSVPIFSVDGVYIRWAHKSLQEYFAAQFIYLDSKTQQDEILLRLYRNPEAEKYSNILDLYYSIDFKSFRRTIIKSLIEEYMFFYSSTYKNFKIPTVLIDDRKNMTFGKDFIIGYSKVKGNDRENVRILFEQMRNAIHPTKGYSISGHFFNIEGNKVFSAANYRHLIMSFLYNKGFSLISVVTDEEKHSSVKKELRVLHKAECLLPEGQFFEITDNIKEPFNSNECFEETNKSIKVASGFRNCYTINISKAKVLLKEIQKEISSEAKNDFLLSGL